MPIFYFTVPASLRYARDFADKRRVHDPQAAMNRLYVVESTPTVTGSMADHRLPLNPSAIEECVTALARGFGVQLAGAAPSSSLADQQKWLRRRDPRSATVIAAAVWCWPATSSRRWFTLWRTP